MKLLSQLSVLAIMLMLVSCGEKKAQEGAENREAATSEKLQIAVIPKGTTHSYWKSVHAGAEKAAKELNVEVIWQGPQKEDDRQMQIQVVQNFIGREVDGIVLSPLDDRSLVQPVSAAVKKGIPVVIVDSDLNSKDFSSFVATDNYDGGRLCAEQLNVLLNGKGKVLVLRYQEGSASTGKREAGFLETIQKIAPGIEVISSNQYAGATIEKAFQASQNLLNRFGELNGIFCPNESTTQGMLRALQTSGKAGKVKFVGFDANETLIAAIKANQIHGLALQNPYKMGYEGVKTLVAVIKKQPFEPKINTGVVMVTKDNMESEEVIALTR
jgi:ribose transport system substrate-binding protein